MPPGHGDMLDVPDVRDASPRCARMSRVVILRVQRDDPVVEAFQPSLGLAHDLRV